MEMSVVKPAPVSPVAPQEIETGGMRHKEGARVECVDMSFSVGKGKNRVKILQNLDIEFVPGELTALMGPSGAGMCRRSLECVYMFVCL